MGVVTLSQERETLCMIVTRKAKMQIKVGKKMESGRKHQVQYGDRTGGHETQ